MAETTAPIRAALEQIGERERELIKRIEGHELLVRNLNRAHDEHSGIGDRVSDRVAAVIGSWRFIIIQSVALVFWILLNSIAWMQHWDPYPFILLNLALSFQAAYAAPIIMMSQNRQEAKDRLRSEHDYDTDIKAELEIEQLLVKLDEYRIGELHDKLDELRSGQWDALLDIQRQQLALLTRLTPAESGDQA